jgi:hypothetical protein
LSGLPGHEQEEEVTEFTGKISSNIQERTQELVNSLKDGEYVIVDNSSVFIPFFRALFPF